LRLKGNLSAFVKAQLFLSSGVKTPIMDGFTVVRMANIAGAAVSLSIAT
jgi:hypothetical protein